MLSSLNEMSSVSSKHVDSGMLNLKKERCKIDNQTGYMIDWNYPTSSLKSENKLSIFIVLSAFRDLLQMCFLPFRIRRAAKLIAQKSHKE